MNASNFVNYLYQLSLLKGTSRNIEYVNILKLCPTAALNNKGRQGFSLDFLKVDFVVNLGVDFANDSNIIAADNVEAKIYEFYTLIAVDAFDTVFQNAVDVLIAAT
jgi:hypothetical protein